MGINLSVVKVKVNLFLCLNNYASCYEKVLYNILIEFGIPMKLVRLIKMCLNETYSKVCIGKYLSCNFPIQNGLKQGDALSPLRPKQVLMYMEAIVMCSAKVHEFIDIKLFDTCCH
jgi:hypothetical protein